MGFSGPAGFRSEHDENLPQGWQNRMLWSPLMRALNRAPCALSELHLVFCILSCSGASEAAFENGGLQDGAPDPLPSFRALDWTLLEHVVASHPQFDTLEIQFSSRQSDAQFESDAQELKRMLGPRSAVVAQISKCF